LSTKAVFTAHAAPPHSPSAAAFRSCQLCVAGEATVECRCCSAAPLSAVLFHVVQVKQRKYLVKMKEDPKQVICRGC
jgi:hypothetical protein